MDDAKRALLKAEDLETRLNTLQKKSVIRAALTYTSAPAYDLRLGSYSLQTVSASASLTILVKASLTLAADCTGTCTLLVGGLPVAVEPVSGQAGDRVEVLFLAGCYVGGTAALTLTGGLPAQLTRIILVIDGDGAGFTGEFEAFAADERDGRILLIASKDDRIIGYGFRTDAVSLDTPFVIGNGRTGDVAALEDGFAVVHADSLGNVFLSMVAADFTLRSTRFLTTGTSSSAAVTADADGLIVAVPSDRGVRLITVGANGRELREMLCPFSGTVKTVAFVKRADVPALVLYDGERAYLKLPVTDTVGTDTAAFTFNMTFSEA